MTEPLSHPPTCYLFIDGVRYNDGCTPDELPTEPVALTDLRVVWGRPTSVDQPSPATAEFSILDLPGGVRFLNTMHMGSLVEVQAEATVYPDPTISTIDHSGFENYVVGAVPTSIRTNGAAYVVGDPVHSGTKATQIQPDNGARITTIIFPPRAFSSSASAWDDIPRTAFGQEWGYGASVFLKQHLGMWAKLATIRPVAFDDPSGKPYTYSILNDYGLVSDPSVDGWQDLLGKFIPPPYVWLGLAVEFNPTGPIWNMLSGGL